MRSTDLHRFLPYGICFLDMKTRGHDLFLRRLFSLTEFLYRTDVIFIFQGWYEWYRFLSDSVLFLWVDLIF